MSEKPLTDEERRICARIRQARLNAGLTLEGLAAKVHFSDRTIGNWEHKRVPYRFLGQIAEATGVEKDWLLRGDDFGDAVSAEVSRRLELLEAEIRATRELQEQIGAIAADVVQLREQLQQAIRR